MDNLTHTLIGVTVAHSLPKRLRKPSIYWASVIGNNLPDSDFIQSQLPGATPLDYLVHHRGYTHSFFSAFLVAYVGAWLAARIAREPGGKTQVTWEIYGTTLLGCFLHVGADFLNNYGVHPFSPLWNRWFYGDTLFIIEPLLWMSLLPFTLFMAQRKWAKAVWGVILLAALGLIWTTEYVAPSFRIAITAVAISSLALHSKYRGAGVAIATIFLVLPSFAFFSRHVKTEIQAHVRATTGSAPVEVEATPFPGNPLCWSSWSTTENETAYLFRSSIVAPIPSLISADRCALNRDLRPRHGNPQALLSEAADSDSKISWKYEVRLSKADLREAWKNSCTFRRGMNFLRFPYLERAGDSTWTAGDLRYDMRDARNFSHFGFRTVDDSNCEESPGPWEPPFFRNQPAALDALTRE